MVTMSPNPLRVCDLEKAFSEFGELTEEPSVFEDNYQSYAYITYKSPLAASEACDAMNNREYKRVRLAVSLTGPGSQESVHSKQHTCTPAVTPLVQVHHPPTKGSYRQIVCDPLHARLITSRIDHFQEQLRSITQSAYVPKITLMKSGNGVNISGRVEDLQVVEKFVKTLIGKLKDELKVEDFSLQCHYIPLFSKPETAKTLFSGIEERFAVEFCVVNNDTKRSIPVNAFATLVSDELFSKKDKIAKTSSISMFLSTLKSPRNEDLWLWEADDGNFTPYSSEICSKLTKEFKLNPTGLFTCEVPTKIGTAKYTINFENMAQRNVRSNNVRAIQHKPGANFQWMYENESGKLVPFSPDKSEEIETERKKSVTKSFMIVKDSTTYVFDLTQMTYTNQDTNKEYKIHQKIVPKGVCLSFSINGLPEDIPTAIECLKLELEKSIIKKSISLPEPVEETGLALQKCASRYFASAEIVNGKLQLEGVEGYLDKLLVVIIEQKHALEKKFLTQRSRVATAQKVELPENWEQQTEKVELKSVQRESLEWNKVASRIRETLPRVDITNVARIQNKWQWDRYSFSKQRMHEKNGGVVNEKELFHGTGRTPPEKIYKSEQGFDFRYASSGMWGTGTYFAVNASYSRSYAHQNGSTRQFILAKVLTGETYRCPSDHNLKKPPVKKHKSASKPFNSPHPLIASPSLPGIFNLGLGVLDSMDASHSSNSIEGPKGDFEDELYDSVSGHTGNSDIFVIYDHEKAYPAYLIDFKD